MTMKIIKTIAVGLYKISEVVIIAVFSVIVLLTAIPSTSMWILDGHLDGGISYYIWVILCDIIVLLFAVSWAFISAKFVKRSISYMRSRWL